MDKPLTVVFAFDDKESEEDKAFVQELFAAMTGESSSYKVTGISLEDEMTVLELYQERVEEEYGVPSYLIEEVREEVLHG